MGKKTTKITAILFFYTWITYVRQRKRQAQAEHKQRCMDLTILQRSKPEHSTRNCLTTFHKNPFTNLTLQSEPSLQRPNCTNCSGK